MSFELFISGRLMRSRRKNAFISLITLLSISGVAMGVMTLIVVLAVMSGYKSEITSRILDENPHIIILYHGGPFSEYRKIVEQVKKKPGIKEASPFVYAQAMLQSSSGVSSAVLRGVDPDSKDRIASSFNQIDIKENDITKDKDKRALMPEIVLGKGLAAKLKVKKDDVIYLISSRGVDSTTSSVPVMNRFRVVAFFESGMYEYDNSFAYIHLEIAQKILNLGDTVSGIGVRVKNIYDAEVIAKDIAVEFTFPYWIRDWMEMNKNLLSMLKLQKTVLFIILTLIIIVAAFNISGTLFMMVMEKTRDIAILRSMGATRRVIERIFIIKGMIISVVGTFIGIFLGFIMCALLKKYQFIKIPEDVYFLTTLPVKMDAFNVILIIISSLLICFFATLYPAKKASSLNPVEAIRNS